MKFTCITKSLRKKTAENFTIKKTKRKYCFFSDTNKFVKLNTFVIALNRVFDTIQDLPCKI